MKITEYIGDESIVMYPGGPPGFGGSFPGSFFVVDAGVGGGRVSDFVVALAASSAAGAASAAAIAGAASVAAAGDGGAVPVVTGIAIVVGGGASRGGAPLSRDWR